MCVFQARMQKQQLIESQLRRQQDFAHLSAITKEHTLVAKNTFTRNVSRSLETLKAGHSSPEDPQWQMLRQMRSAEAASQMQTALQHLKEVVRLVRSKRTSQSQGRHLLSCRSGKTADYCCYARFILNVERSKAEAGAPALDCSRQT